MASSPARTPSAFLTCWWTSGVKPDVALSGAGDLDDACLVTASATLLHDIGNQLHRQRHELLGVGLAQACSTG